MVFRSSWVYWLFRVYAICIIVMAVLHISGWVVRSGYLHRVANCVLIFGLVVGFVPLIGTACQCLLARNKKRS